MTTYEILDAIADSYNPLLFIGYVIFAGVYWRRGDRLAAVKGFAGILVAYALMFTDNALHIWASLGLDYSTHSAVALALVGFHLHKRPWSSPAAMGLFTSLLLYYALMVYQQYHTVMDILTTAIIVGPLVAAVYWAIGKLCPACAAMTEEGGGLSGSRND